MKLTRGSPPSGGILTGFPSTFLICQYRSLLFLTATAASFNALSLMMEPCVAPIAIIFSFNSLAFFVKLFALLCIIFPRSSSLIPARCDIGAISPSILLNAFAQLFECRSNQLTNLPPSHGARPRILLAPPMYASENIYFPIGTIICGG